MNELRNSPDEFFIMETKLSPFGFLEELWLNFRLTNDECKKICPDIPQSIKEKFQNLVFDKEILDLSASIFMNFLVGKHDVIVIASAKKTQDAFYVQKRGDFKFFTGELVNCYSTLICDTMLEENLDPTLSISGIFLYNYIFLAPGN